MCHMQDVLSILDVIVAAVQTSSFDVKEQMEQVLEGIKQLWEKINARGSPSKH